MTHETNHGSETMESRINDLTTAYTDKRGYRVVNIKSDETFEAPMEIIAENDAIYAYRILIPYCHRTATVVYFVSGRNGDEFGQFPSQGQAQLRFNAVASAA